MQILEWYIDSDGDGFGSPFETLASCIEVEGYVDSDDCNDEIHWKKALGRSGIWIRMAMALGMDRQALSIARSQ